MADLILRNRIRRLPRRERVFRDRNHPLDRYDDVELYNRFRFRRQDILELMNEDADTIELSNRRGTLSPVLQVICDANLLFINIIAKWPGSVHDACILRESPFYDAMESNQPPVRGHLLGDSGYMLRDWLMTPVFNPETPEEGIYNEIHTQTRCTVERSFGVAKMRWHCLCAGLRVSPERACEIITVCFILHNHARFLALPDPDSDDEDDNIDDNDADEYHVDVRDNIQVQERVRVAAGKVARNRLI